MVVPLLLPVGIDYTDFDISFVTLKDVSRVNGRRSEIVQFGQGFWRASLTTQFLHFGKSAVMDVWLMGMSGTDNVCLVHDLERQRPALEGDGTPLSGVKALGGAFDGTCNLVSITNSREVVIDGLPAEFQLSPADYVEFRMSDLLRSLHMIVEPVTANASGEATLKFRHDLDTGHFTDVAVVNFEKPSCVMALVGAPVNPKGWSSRKVSFNMSEVFFQ